MICIQCASFNMILLRYIFTLCNVCIYIYICIHILVQKPTPYCGASVSMHLLYEGQYGEKLPILHGCEGRSHHILEEITSFPMLPCKKKHIARKYEAPYHETQKEVLPKPYPFCNKYRVSPYCKQEKQKKTILYSPYCMQYGGKWCNMGSFVP